MPISLKTSNSNSDAMDSMCSPAMSTTMHYRSGNEKISYTFTDQTDGKSVDPKYIRATLKKCLPAAKKGNFQAVKALVDLAFNTKNSEAQYQLGRLFKFGLGVQHDPQNAYFCFSEAAKQKHTDATYQQGSMLYDGNGVMQDKQMGEALMATAYPPLPKRKFANSIAVNTTIYTESRKRQRLNKEKIEYSNQKVENKLDQLTITLIPINVTQVENKDFLGLYDVHRKELPMQTFTFLNQQDIPKCYQDTSMVDKQLEIIMQSIRKFRFTGYNDKAMKGLVELAFLANNAKAQYQLGKLFQLGHGVKQDNAVANLCFQKSANQGYDRAVNDLLTNAMISLSVSENHSDDMDEYEVPDSPNL